MPSNDRENVVVQKGKVCYCGLQMKPYPYGNYPNILYCDQCHTVVTLDGVCPRELMRN
jgi:hypothetical protein